MESFEVLVIIADDLTGALDTAAPFAARKLRTEVALTLDAVARKLGESPDVLSINLASRELAAGETYQLMRRVFAMLPPDIRLFKKVDSRLKGHISVELDAFSYARALVAPAIPAFGRVVRQGHVEGFGVAAPISVAAALGSHADRSSIIDASTDCELQDALAAGEAEGVDLLVGARGLAEALAIKMTGVAEAGLVEPPEGPALFVIGSHDPITSAQVERMRACEGVSYSAAPNGIIDGPPPEKSPLTLVQAIDGDRQLAPDEVARNLSTSVHPQLTQQAQTLMLCGGATAEAVLRMMGIDCFRLEGECLPGLGLAYAGKQCIIAKSGGFGEPETLATLAAKLHGGRG